MGGWVWWLSCFFRQVSEILSTSISLSVNGNDNHNTGDLVVKNLSAYAGDTRDRGFSPWVGKILWRRKWQPTPVFLPGKSHGQRSLAGYSPWGHQESDTAEWLSAQTENTKNNNNYRLKWGCTVNYLECLMHVINFCWYCPIFHLYLYSSIKIGV